MQSRSARAISVRTPQYPRCVAGRRTRCGDCGGLLDRADACAEGREQYLRCGSDAHRFEQDVEVTVDLRSSLLGRARHATGRWFLEHFVGAEFSMGLGRWMHKVRRIDRRGDRYDEVVTAPETGGIVHETHEPLSEHWGHGSAKTHARPVEEHQEEPLTDWGGGGRRVVRFVGMIAIGLVLWAIARRVRR